MTKVPPYRCFLSIPYYQFMVGQCFHAPFLASQDMRQVLPFPHGDAFLARNFNTGWKEALNSRETHKLTHFAMIHCDVAPYPDYWLDSMVLEMERTGADLLSIVLPIKTHHGVSSTAIEGKDGRIRRLTMREIDAIPHRTFDAALAGYLDGKILCSTGLWICDFTRPWVEDVWFEVRDRLVKRRIEQRKVKFEDHTDYRDVMAAKEKGLSEITVPAHTEFDRLTHAEDWHFSKLLHDKGLRIMASKLIPCDHYGVAPFRNMGAWGTTDHDEWSEPIDWLRRGNSEGHVEYMDPHSGEPEGTTTPD